VHYHFGGRDQLEGVVPAARQEVVPKGNHFPMGDAPDTVAGWIRQWHAGQAR
jgi:hypothetical protein